ncbi:hypothetical protein D8Y20_00170 [Mariprofundus sp. EBB-1]|uniref:hypothetical protein n=1 Tax=Mariprofundus sp. EBB-1 TaxID=2650971 RepID=UPI000EF20FE2|nr:hypothetical protein [Mariprofundus sp. EBB-1]RLL55900.1 hypothetical protein D8Y20_00170 [Mariprofundus sp. EBB-1]
MFTRLIPLICVTVVCFCSPALLVAAELYAEQVLLEEPSKKSVSVGIGAKGVVSVIERRGYWVKLKAGNVVGWTELGHVKMDETVQWMAPIDVLRDTGRLGKAR